MSDIVLKRLLFLLIIYSLQHCYIVDFDFLISNINNTYLNLFK